MNRRELFAAGAAVAVVAAPAQVQAQSRTRQELIQRHAEALTHLLREELPENTDRIQVFVSLDEGTTYIGAEPMKKTWNPNPRLVDGGYYTEHAMGRWSPALGYRSWGTR